MTNKHQQTLAVTTERHMYLYQGKVLVDSNGHWLHDALTNITLVSWQPQALLLAAKNPQSIYLQILDNSISIPDQLVLVTPRELFALVSEEEFALVAKAVQLSHWLRDHRYCGRCGNRTYLRSVEYGLSCAACQLTQYPRLSPCIIVAITGPRGILLGRSKHFVKGRYSTLAGFVEVGESVEDAVHREVMEEVGVQIDHLEYMFSQSWPFPHSLMLGYLAHYQTGKIQVDGVEIEDAQWFDTKQLPDLPGENTIARKLINLAIERLASTKM